MKVKGEGEGGQVARNVAKVLNEMGHGLLGALGVLVYFNSGYGSKTVEEVEAEAESMTGENGGVRVGEDEGHRPWEGYEDYETWLELEGGAEGPPPRVPVMAVEVESMPVGAKVEWEVVALSKEAMCLGPMTRSFTVEGSGSEGVRAGQVREPKQITLCKPGQRHPY